MQATEGPHANDSYRRAADFDIATSRGGAIVSASGSTAAHNDFQRTAGFCCSRSFKAAMSTRACGSPRQKPGDCGVSIVLGAAPHTKTLLDGGVLQRTPDGRFVAPAPRAMEGRFPAKRLRRLPVCPRRGPFAHEHREK